MDDLEILIVPFSAIPFWGLTHEFSPPFRLDLSPLFSLNIFVYEFSRFLSRLTCFLAIHISPPFSVDFRLVCHSTNSSSTPLDFFTSFFVFFLSLFKTEFLKFCPKRKKAPLFLLRWPVLFCGERPGSAKVNITTLSPEKGATLVIIPVLLTAALDTPQILIPLVSDRRHRKVFFGRIQAPHARLSCFEFQRTCCNTTNQIFLLLDA